MKSGNNHFFKYTKKLKHYPKTILVCGAGPGVGVSHTVIMLAYYLKRKGGHPALMELSGNGDFRRIERQYYGEASKPYDAYFRLRQVPFYPDSSEHQYKELYGTYKGSIILDMGVYQLKDPYYYADQIWFVVQGSDWRLEEGIHMISNLPSSLRNKVKILMPLVHKNSLEEMKKRTGLPTYELKCCVNPYIKSEPIHHLFDQLLG